MFTHLYYLGLLQILLAFMVAGKWWFWKPTFGGMCYGFLHGVFANALALTLLGTFYPLLLPTNKVFRLRFLVLYLTLTIICAVVSGVFLRRIQTVGKDKEQPGSQKLAIGGRRFPEWLGVAIRIVLYALAAVVVAVMFYAARWVAVTFSGVQADQLLFFIMGGKDPGATPAQMIDLFNRIVMPSFAFLVTVLCLPLLGWGGEKLRNKATETEDKTVDYRNADAVSVSATVKCDRGAKCWDSKTLRWASNLVVLVCAVGAIGYCFTVLPVAGVLKTYFVRSNFIEKHYVEPTDKIMHFPAKPRNLIHFYLESMENSYYDKAQGGYLEQDLMPDLGKLTKENISFSNRETFGGPMQTFGADHSVAGMLNYQAGVPMIPIYSSTTAGRISYPDFTTIGDILHKHGYNTYYMLCTGKYWHHLDQYYKLHGDFGIFDLHEARDRKLVPPNYAVWWGIEDDKLYEYAKTELTRLGNLSLGQKGKPFYLILENADTHANGGYVSPRMKEFPSKFQYGNVIHYSQKEVVKLVRWMQKQPWYKDTLIVLTGDHKSMDNKFFVGWDPKYQRTVVNVFINSALPDPGPGRTKNRQYAPFDYFPTIMESLGIKVDGDRLGLGTSLYSKKPTLLEQYGFKYVNNELEKRSTFYENHRPAGGFDLGQPY